MADNRAQELDAALLRLQRECCQAVAAAQVVLGCPTTPRGSPHSSEDGLGAVSVEDVVRQLIAKLKVISWFVLLALKLALSQSVSAVLCGVLLSKSSWTMYAVLDCQIA